MKKFISTLALTAVLAAPSFAQVERVNPMSDRSADVTSYSDDRNYSEDYAKMIRSQYEVDMRSLTSKALGLSSEEITGFTPLLMSYMDAKKALNVERNELVDEYGEEMAEDDTVKDENEETADFIENYMEVDIREMELKKDYFDKLEDVIGYDKALTFFDIEKMYSDRIQRMALVKTIPTQPVLYVLEPVTYSYETQVNDYNNWNKIYINGEVGLDHNYTYNGLQKLLTAAEAMVAAEGINVVNFDSRKAMIMEKAGQMKENWRSLSHADLARQAFTETASILKDIANDGRFSVSDTWTNKLVNNAKAINPSVKLTDQGDEVNAFFSSAQYIVNDLVDQANGMTK
ncbi:hypothetical protein [Lewinella sp. 4G2]|uniref:hypothetical protein n=1 Tax=Lewinella sp. 4G2 TaxID=1803372 RepID=UPI0007B4EF70|nr:hypothetical protein [Lewinella sp. 4G2]OAV44491.1 hypothetical protein A3850_008300 [Lewinella sp. 4G2]